MRAVKAQSRLGLYRLSIRLLTIGDVLAQIRTFEFSDLEALLKDKSHHEERKQFQINKVAMWPWIANMRSNLIRVWLGLGFDFKSQSTAMVISRWSVHLTGQA